MELANLIRRRRIVHRFEQRSIPAETIDAVLETALHAPSAGFSQGFAMIVIDEPERVRWFHETTGEEEVLGFGPPVLVLALASAAVYLERYSRPDKVEAGLQKAESWPVPYWWVDAGMAVMLILLAAVDHGLGGWFYGVTEGQSEVLDRLGVPSGWEIIGVIGLGYQAADDQKLGSSTTIPRRVFDEVVRRHSW
jgi:nitroreductase